MIAPERLGLAFWRDDFRFHQVFREGGYFVFVEAAEQVDAERAVAPDGGEIANGTVPGGRPWRFRSSGIRSRSFLVAMDRIEPLDHDDVTDSQRELRRAQLVELFGEAPLPLLDLYVEEKRPELAFLRAVLVPGAWYFMAVSQQEPADDRLAIFVGAPELARGPYSPGSLEFLEAVPPYVEYRLRDIFSLVHVRDAGLEEEGGETTPPPPDLPWDGKHPAAWFESVREVDTSRLPEAEA